MHDVIVVYGLTINTKEPSMFRKFRERVIVCPYPDLFYDANY